MKQYSGVEKRIRHVRRTAYKTAPLWKEKKKVRVVLSIPLVVGTIAAVVAVWESHGALPLELYKLGENHALGFDGYFLALADYLMLFAFVPAMVYFIYRFSLKDRCLGVVGHREYTLATNETELRLLYVGENCDVVEDVIQLKDVRRVRWNETQQQFEIFAPVTQVHYEDYVVDRIDRKITDESYLEQPFRFYWIYSTEDLQDFKEDLQRGTGIEIEQAGGV